MRGRVTVVLAVLATAVAALIGGGGSALADAAGQERPQFVDAWGTSGAGDANLENPRGVAVDDDTGDIYVADTANDRIVRYDADGRLLDTFGTAAVGNPALPLATPWDVAVDHNGFVYVADTANNRVVVFDANGNFLRTWGVVGSADGQFRKPKGIYTDSGNFVWVADTNNNRIQRFTAQGVHELSFGTVGSGNGQLRKPRDVATNISNRVFVADTGNNRVSVFDRGGVFVSTFGSAGSLSRQFDQPSGIYVQNNDAITTSVFVADTGNDRVTVWSNTGTYERKFGGTGGLGHQMVEPRNVFVDSANRRFVIDTGNDRLQLFDVPIAEGIAGRVTDATSGLGHELGIITISDAATLDLVAVVQTDAEGDYQAAVPPGDYAVAFVDQTGAYDFEYFEDEPDFTSFDPVTVTAGVVTTADLAVSQPFGIPPGSTGEIVGTVTEGPSPAAGTWVLAVDSTGRVERAVQADPVGDYRIAGVEVGNYLLLFLDPRGVNATEFYDDAVDPTFADLVVVTTGVTTTADADLQP